MQFKVQRGYTYLPLWRMNVARRCVIKNIGFIETKSCWTLRAEPVISSFPSCSHTSFSLLFFSSRLVLSCSSVSSCLTAYLVITSSSRDRATSLLDRSLRSSEGSNRAGSVASEGREEQVWGEWGGKRDVWWVTKNNNKEKGRERKWGQKNKEL